MPPRSTRRTVSGSSARGWPAASSASLVGRGGRRGVVDRRVVVSASAGAGASAVAVVPVEDASAAAPASALAAFGRRRAGIGQRRLRVGSAMTPMRSGFAAFAVDRLRVRLGGFGVASGIGSDLEHRG